MPLNQIVLTATGALPVMIRHVPADDRWRVHCKCHGGLGGDLRGDAVPCRGEPALDGGGVLSAHAVSDERIVFGVQQRAAIGDVERPIHQFLQGAQIHAAKGGVVVDCGGVGILRIDSEKVRAWRPGAGVPQGDIEIKHQERIFCALGAKVAV